jgi:formate hydrogenlyase subunit 3/multisubunit Na+/H+ antiporter MnhD subunit
VIGGAPGLALVPAPLVLAVLILYALPATARRASQLVGVAAALATIALLSLNLYLIGGGSVEATYGTPISGVTLLTRADRPGLTLAMAASAIALLLLIDGRRTPARAAALIVCTTGAVIAALAGNAVVLFGGLELANVGTLLLLASERRRPGRGALAALIVEHAAALGLLAAVVQLQGTTGTTDFTALPAGALAAGVAVPWAIAGAARLLAPLVMPLRGSLGEATVWTAVGALPAGAAVLLRLREAADGPLVDRAVLVLAAFGAAAVVAGVVAAAMWSAAPAFAGRALVVATAGFAIAVAGFPGGLAAAALAAGLCQLVLLAGVSIAWERRPPPGRWRVPGGAALVIAAGLPLGFGTTALTFELGAAVSLGRAGAALLVVLAVGAVVAAAAGVRAAFVYVTTGTSTAQRRPSPVAAVALTGSLIAAAVPGAVAGSLMAALGGAGGSAGNAVAVGAGGGWPGGYFLAALLLAVAGAWAVANLAGLKVAMNASLQPVSEPHWWLPLTPWRLVRNPARRIDAAAGAVDRWLVVQPQLPLVVIAALLAVLLIH